MQMKSWKRMKKPEVLMTYFHYSKQGTVIHRLDKEKEENVSDALVRL